MESRLGGVAARVGGDGALAQFHGGKTASLSTGTLRRSGGTAGF
jgi:hypothetical protein